MNKSNIQLVYPREITPREEKILSLCMAKLNINVAREEVVLSLKNQLPMVEPKLNVLDAGFPVPKNGEIDLLAVDENSNLLLINVVPDLDAKMILQFLTQVDWIKKNKEILYHFYGERIRNENIRLWILNRHLIPDVECLLKYLDPGINLEIFTYNCFVLSGKEWLVIQPCSTLDAGSKKHDSRSMKDEVQNHASCPIHHVSEITQEEINDFFDENN